MFRYFLGVFCLCMLALSSVLLGAGLVRGFAEHWFLYTIISPLFVAQVLISANGIRSFFFR